MRRELLRLLLASGVYLFMAVVVYVLSFVSGFLSSLVIWVAVLGVLLLEGYGFFTRMSSPGKRGAFVWKVVELFFYYILLSDIYQGQNLIAPLVIFITVFAIFPLSVLWRRNYRELELKVPCGFSVALHFKLLDSIERILARSGAAYRREGNRFRVRESDGKEVLIEVDADDEISPIHRITIKNAKNREYYENMVNSALLSLPPLSSFRRDDSFYCPSCRSPVSFEISEGTFFCGKCRQSIKYGDVIRHGGTGNL